MVVEVKSRPEAMEASQPRVEAHILLLGARNVGKTALAVRFLTRRFIGEYGDIESIYSRVDKVDGQEVGINIWDSQAGGEIGSISDEQLQWADGMVLVYDICDRSSFELVARQLRLIRRSRKMTSLPVVVVANKRDLQLHRHVSGGEGRLLALTERCGFFETYHGVLLVFHRLAGLVPDNRALRWSLAGVRGIVRSVSAMFASLV